MTKLQIKLFIDKDNIEALVEIIKNLISVKWEQNRAFERNHGDDYYNSIQPVKTNSDTSLVINLYKVLVDQKVSYLNIKNFVINVEEKSEENLEFKKFLEDFYTKRQRMLRQIATKNCINFGNAIVKFSINEVGQLMSKTSDPKYMITIYDGNNDIDAAIEFSTFVEFDGKTTKTLNEFILYFKEGFIIIRENLSGRFNFIGNNGEVVDFSGADSIFEKVMIVYSISFEKDNRGEVVETKENPLDVVPIVEYLYNEKKIPLLQHIKEIQDQINIQYSDYAKNMLDIQEIITVFEGFNSIGEIDLETNQPKSQEKILKELMIKMKDIKAIMAPTDQHGNTTAKVDFKSVEIPTNGRNSFIEKLESKIFEVGQGLKIDDLINANTLSGVGIQKLFSLLDLDVEAFKTFAETALEKELEIIIGHYNMINKKQLKKEDFSFTIYKNIIINSKEALENAVRLIAIKNNPQAVLNILESQGVINSTKDFIEEELPPVPSPNPDDTDLNDDPPIED